MSAQQQMPKKPPRAVAELWRVLRCAAVSTANAAQAAADELGAARAEAAAAAGEAERLRSEMGAAHAAAEAADRRAAAAAADAANAEGAAEARAAAAHAAAEQQVLQRRARLCWRAFCSVLFKKNRSSHETGKPLGHPYLNSALAFENF